MKDRALDKILDIVRESLYEDVPVNNIGGGQIAGTAEAGDDPPARKKKKKYIYQKGLRKMWSSANGRSN